MRKGKEKDIEVNREKKIILSQTISGPVDLKRPETPFRHPVGIWIHQFAVVVAALFFFLWLLLLLFSQYVVLSHVKLNGDAAFEERLLEVL